MNQNNMFKGFITAALMIAVVLITYYGQLPASSPIQYLVYIVYALGIAWTLLAWRNNEAYTGRFADSFLRGFQCFIIVTLTMTLFTFLFNKMHPEFLEESAQAYRAVLQKDKGVLPNQVDEAVTNYRSKYMTVLIFGSIIGYLIIGVAVTAAVSAFLPKRK